MTQETALRAKKYSQEKYILTVLDILFSVYLFLLIQFSGLSQSIASCMAAVSANRYIGIASYAFTFIVVYSIFALPLNFYRSFILEHKFGLSTQSFRDWLKDALKSFFVSCLIFLILIEIFYAVLDKFPSVWWLIVSFFWILFSIILAQLLPVLIIPLFFKYKPLSDAALKERIIKLADKMQVKLLDVYEIDFSKKTTKANAAFVGMGKTKRVILADTLKSKYTHEEIEVILAHEFAHYRLKHLLKLIVINSSATVVLTYAIFVSSGYILNRLNLGPLNEISNLPFILLYVIFFNIVMAPFSNFLSRRLEKEADRLSLETTMNKQAFIGLMNKLAEQNLADRKPAKLIKIFFFDHPPIDERIECAHISI